MADFYSSVIEPQQPTEGAAARPASEGQDTSWMTNDFYGEVQDPIRTHASRFLRDQLSTGKPWEETAKHLQGIGVQPEKLKESYERGLQAKQLRQAKSTAEGPSTLEQFRRAYMPFGSVINARRADQYTAAKARFDQGAATQEDIDRIAHFEELQAFDQRLHKGSLFLRGIDAFGKVAGMVGEASVAGGMMSKLGLSGPAATYVGGAGRRAVMTAAMPSMWVDHWTQKNIEEGRSATDLRGLPPALALGYANTLVLGRLQNRAGTVAGKALLGVGESQAVQATAGLVDEFLPKAYQMGTRYGSIGRMLRGEVGEAGMDLAVELLTFGMFAGVHRHDGTPAGNRAATEAGLESVRVGTEAIDALVRSGLSPQAASARLSQVGRIYTDGVTAALERGETLAREDAPQLFGAVLKNAKDPLHKWARMLADQLPPRAEIPPRGERGPAWDPGIVPPERPAEAARPEPAPGAESPHLEAAPQPVAEPAPVAEKPKLPANTQATTPIPPAEPAKAPVVEATPEPPKIPIEDLRGVAKSIGLDARGSAEVLEARLRKAGAGPIVDQLRPVERGPEVPDPSQKATESPVRAEKAPPAQPSPEAEIARPGANAEAVPIAEAAKPTTNRPKGIKLGGATLLERGTPMQPAEAHAFDKYGNGARLELHDDAGNPVGFATVHESGDTLHVSWMGASGLAGGEGRGAHPFGPKEIVSLGKQIAVSFPDFKVLMYTPSEGRIKAGETRGYDLDKARERLGIKPEAKAVEPPAGAESPHPQAEAKAEPPAPEPPAPDVPPPPAPKLAKQKVGETDWAHQNRLRRESGATTLADYVKGYGGIDPASVSPGERKMLQESELRAVLTDKYGRKGRNAIDTLAEHLVREGYLEPDASRNPTDALVDAVKNHRIVSGEEKWAEAEMLRHQEEAWKLHREMEDARTEALKSEDVARVEETLSRADQVADALAQPTEPARRPGEPPSERASPGELTEEWARDFVESIEDKAQWRDVPADIRRQLKEKFGLEWTGKKRASRVITGDEEAQLDPEHEMMIDNADLTPAEKIGVKALMSGFSVRAAEKAARDYSMKVTGLKGPSYETIRKRAVELFGETAYKTVEQGAQQRRIAAAERVKRLENEKRKKSSAEAEIDAEPDDFVGPGTYFHRQKPAADAATGAESPHPEPVSPFEIIASQNKIFGTRGYTESTIPFRGADAVALTREGTTVTKRTAAGDPDINLEEHAHHLVTRLGMPLDAADLPPGVAEGFRQMWDPKGKPGREAIVEGFGQWLLARSNNTLNPKTEAQKAAAEYAEAWAAEKGLTHDFDRVRDMRAQAAGASAEERFGLLVSKTGDAAIPQKGEKKERVKEYVKDVLNSQAEKKLDDLYEMAQIEGREAARRRAAGIAPAPEGTLPSEVFRAARYRSMAESSEMTAHGVHYYDARGQQVKIGKGYEQIAAEHGLTAEEIANGGSLDTFMRARETVYLASQGRSNRPAEQVELARQAMEEFKKDPERLKRLTAAADEVTDKIFNASLIAMEKAGFLEEGTAKVFMERNPYYTPNTRIMGTDGVRIFRTGGGGGPGFTKARSSSGEEMIGLADAVADRMDYTAYVLTKQMKDQAFFEFFRQNGHGDDVLLHPLRLTEEGRAAVKNLKASGMEPDEVWTHIDAMGEAAASYFEPGSWQADPRRRSYVFMIDGKPVRALVNNESLHKILTGTQGEGQATMQVAAALNAVSRPIAQLQRLGFTLLSPLYHLHNLMPWRDAATYLGRTVSEKGFIKDVKDVYNWYANSFVYYAGKLIGREPSNVYFKLYDQMVQRNMDSTAQQGLGSKKLISGGWLGLYQRVTDLMGFGEKALHVAEMKNVWDKAGWTQERIKAALEADPTGAHPVPLPLQIAAYNAAAQVTHNYLTMGYQVRALNKSWPFLGVHIASAYKDIATMATRPGVALRGLSVLLAAKILHWALYHDEEEYKQLSIHRRDGFIFKTPVGWVGMPGPRGVQTPILALMDEGLRHASESNPQFASLVGRTLHQVGVHGGPAGIATGLEVLANRTQGGFPIVPKWDEELPAGEKFRKYQLPHMVGQMSGSIVPAQQIAKGGYDPLKSLMLPPQHETVTRLREMVEDLKGEQLSAKRAGKRFKDENRYARLAHAEAEIRNLSAKLAQKENATEADRVETNRRQVAIAKRALGE